MAPRSVLGIIVVGARSRASNSKGRRKSLLFDVGPRRLILGQRGVQGRKTYTFSFLRARDGLACEPMSVLAVRNESNGVASHLANRSIVCKRQLNPDSA